MDESRAVLQQLPLLGFLPADVKKLVVDSFEPTTLPFGSVVVHEGEPADAFYVLAAGKARVLKSGSDGQEISLNILRPGDSFGEMGLLEQTTRTATVRTSSEVDLFRLDRAVFQALLRTRPEIKDYLELQIKYRNLNDFFRLHSPFARLPVEALRVLVTELGRVEVSAGNLVIREGEDAGPMYVVEEGRLRVYTGADARPHYRRNLRKGDFFGELSLFKGSRRTASVEALTLCRLLAFTPDTFARLVREYPAFKEQIEQRIAQYEYRSQARVPGDFGEEVLPAEAVEQEKVRLDQVERVITTASSPSVSLTEEEAAPFATSEGFFVKKPRRWRRFPQIYQIDEMDCGAACLAMVCRAFGRRVSLARIRQLVHTSFDGVSLPALCRGGTELGLAATTVKASSENLLRMPLPAIVHWGGNHWVVLHEAEPDMVRLADPSLGPRKMSREEFEKNWSGFAVLYDYKPEFEQAPEGRSVLGWLWPFFRPFAGPLAGALGLAVVVSALQMILPIFIKIVVDHVLTARDAGMPRTLALGMAAAFAVMGLAMIGQRWLLSHAAARIDATALDVLTWKLLSLPVSFFHTRRAGDILRRLSAVRQVREFLVQNSVQALSAMTQLLAALVLMFCYSRVLAGVFLVMAPMYAALMLMSSRWLRPLFQSLDESLDRYRSRQVDAVRGIEAVKMQGAEDDLRALLLRDSEGIACRQFRADFGSMCHEGAVQLLALLSLALFIWIGSQQVLTGAMTIGALVAFTYLAVLSGNAIGVLLPLWDELQNISILLDRLHDIFEQSPEQEIDASSPSRSLALEGGIRVQGLGFRHGGPESPRILEGISFSAPVGSRVAIVGRGGAGKTTLVQCLAGLLEPTEGVVLFDNIEPKAIDRVELRRQIGLVRDQNYLFNDSIARNIALGEDEPNLDAVRWAARMACAHEFIDRMPLGYDTRVGESGLTLSMSQRQRLAIARALYHRPPVLILDEALGVFDSEIENRVRENLDSLMAGRTLIVVDDRLRSIRDVDLILVLEKGKLVEQGTHEQLMKLQGLYFYLSSRQIEK